MNGGKTLNKKTWKNGKTQLEHANTVEENLET